MPCGRAHVNQGVAITTLLPLFFLPVPIHTRVCSNRVCVFITAGPSTKLFAWGGGGIWEDMCYERRRAEACVD
jgi:hypothetical protein